MSTATDLSGQVRDLTDRQELTELVSRLYVLLDEERFDELRSVYTDDVHLEFPSATMHGIDEAIAVARRRGAKYDRMQHLSTDVVIELDGDRAAVRTNHWALHVHPTQTAAEDFQAGVVHRFDAVRTPGGWRLNRGHAEVVWTSGTPGPR